MKVRFRPLMSGSSGNAVMVWDDSTRILVDCGVRSQRACRAMLDSHASDAPPLAGVVVSHLHGDHICYSSLRVLEEKGAPVYIHADDHDELRRRHFQGRAFDALKTRAFDGSPFRLGAFQVRPFPVTHAPDTMTHGFLITRGCRGRELRIAVATDLCGWDGAAEHLKDADVIYVEANHDADLLEKYPNWNSHYHMENRRTGELLLEALSASSRPPQVIALAHLSEQRNTPELALATVGAALAQGGFGATPLKVASRSEATWEATLD